MKLTYKLSALCGLAYTRGNILFSDEIASPQSSESEHDSSHSRAILSPVGNRVSSFDLASNKLTTFDYQTRNHVRVMALSPNGLFLVVIDQEGRGLLINYHRQVVLSHFNIKAKVKRVAFSPDSSCFAVGYTKMVEIWQVPKVAHMKEFAPLVLKVKIRAHFDQVTSLCWSPDSRYLLTASKDMTAKVLAMDGPEDYEPFTLAAHKDGLLGAFFAPDMRTIYTVSKEGALFEWTWEVHEEVSQDMAATLDPFHLHPARGRFVLAKKNYFQQVGKLTAVACHMQSGLLAVGLSTGVFQICQLPELTILQTLSVFQGAVNTIALNASADWLALGSIASGQLVVWEWRSETFVLRQQGRYEDVQCVAYASEGQLMATGSVDGRVKLWHADSAFSFVTFSDHLAPVHSVEFTKRGRVLLSAAADGTVRAYDLIRYRNFRVLSSPKPVVFSSLAADPSGEIIVAGSWDTFEIYVWSLQTGHLLELLTGHQGPVCSLAFDPLGRYCVSGSMDKSLRLWTLYTSETDGDSMGVGLSRNVQAQSFDVGSEVLAVCFRPDGREVAVASLNGQVGFWNPETGAQVGSIDGGRDIAGGRLSNEVRTLASSARSRHFTSLCYSADSSMLLAGGLSKFICIYDAQSLGRPLLKKFVTTRNLSIEGLQEKLNSKLLTEAGQVSLLAAHGQDASDKSLYHHALTRLDDSQDEEDGDFDGPSGAGHSLASKLPGVGKRGGRPSIRTRSVRFSPDGRSWIAATTEGLLLYSLDETLVFDPMDLAVDLTPELVRTTFLTHPSRALIMALALNEPALTHEIMQQVPLAHIEALVTELSGQSSLKHVDRLLNSLALLFEKSVPFIERHLAWIRAILQTHGETIKRKIASSTARGIGQKAVSLSTFSATTLLGSLRSLQKSIMQSYAPLSQLSNENRHLIYLLANLTHD